MALWTRLVDNWLPRRSLSRLPEAWYVSPTAAGMSVTPELALTVPAVAACIHVLAQDVGRTPVKLRRRLAEDRFDDAPDHPLWEILMALPNPETTSYQFKYQMQASLLTYGRAYAEVQRVDGRIVALWPLDSRRMTVDRDSARRKRYRYRDENGQQHEWLFDPSRPPILELAMDSPIMRCRELIGTALALQRYVGKFFANGARLGGVLQAQGPLPEASIRTLRQAFTDVYAGSDNAHKVAVLDSGLEYKPFAAANDDSQLNETMRYLRTEIAGVFRVPPHKIGDLSEATYSNIEAQSTDYMMSSLDPYFVAWEQALERDVLTSRQYPQFDITFDREALIRSDVKSRLEGLALARNAGVYSTNDIRRKLGENLVPASDGGDLYLVNANMVPMTQTGKPEQENE
jgi:HK97 family phage portal protein